MTTMQPSQVILQPTVQEHADALADAHQRAHDEAMRRRRPTQPLIPSAEQQQSPAAAPVVVLAPTLPELSTLSIIVRLNMPMASATDTTTVARMMARFDRRDVRDAMRRMLGVKAVFGLVSNGFRNSITFEYQNTDAQTWKNKKSVKAFLSTGKLQIAGIRAYQEIPDVVACAVGVLRLLLDMPTPHTLEAIDIKVSFAQATFDLCAGIDTWALHQQLLVTEAVPPSRVSISEQVYGRLRIGYPNQPDGKTAATTTVMVFPSGKVILTGFQQPEQMAAAYQSFIDLVEQAHMHPEGGVTAIVTARRNPTAAAAADAPKRVPAKRGRKRKQDTLEFMLLNSRS
jgi:TATA-box binding protein (TBP) (component of TFIID and TFIIIB)